VGVKLGLSDIRLQTEGIPDYGNEDSNWM